MCKIEKLVRLRYFFDVIIFKFNIEKLLLFFFFVISQIEIKRRKKEMFFIYLIEMCNNSNHNNSHLFQVKKKLNSSHADVRQCFFFEYFTSDNTLQI